MIFNIKRQENYSRGELLLRTFFGWLYIGIPHMLVLIFIGMYGSILQIVAWWMILFNGVYPKTMFDFQVKLIHWNMRLLARQMNMRDGYPAFGLDEEDEGIELHIPYPEIVSRGGLLVRTLFGGIYIVLPHIFVWYFRLLATAVLSQVAFFMILFTGEYPESFFNFNVGTFRWIYRVSLHMSHMREDYPPFSGKTDEELGLISQSPMSMDEQQQEEQSTF